MINIGNFKIREKHITLIQGEKYSTSYYSFKSDRPATDHENLKENEHFIHVTL